MLTTMIDDEIQIVQHTWLDIAKHEGPSIGVLFYTKLFEQSPPIKLVLRNDASSHGKKFVSMMNYLIEKLDTSNVIHEARSLGRKYADYGLRTEHYDSIKEALFWALRNKLGDKWTPNVMVSWIWFYSTISCIMKDAGRERYA